MKKIKILIVILLGGLLSGSSIFAQEFGEDEVGIALRKMVDARTNCRYMGDLSIKVLKGTRSRVYNKKIWIEPPNKMREEIVFPGTEKTIIRISNNDKFETRINGRNFLTERRRHPRQGFRILSMMRKNNDITISDDVMIAGRETRLILMKPKMEKRRNVRVWVDKETGVTLKKEIFGYDDEVLVPVYQMHFTNIDYNYPENPELFRIKEKRRSPRVNTREFTSIEEAKQQVRFPFLTPDIIPNGYQLGRVRVARERGNVTVHLNYSNGITSFSIFQTRGRIPHHFRRSFDKNNENNVIEIARGSRTIFFRKLGPFNLTLIGNCPKEILKPVIESFSPPEKPQF